MILPSYIDPEAYQAWIDMRKRKKVPWSDRCHKRALKRLQEIKEAGYDANQALEDSEFYGWTDIYPPKDRRIAPSETVSSGNVLSAMESARRESQSPQAIKAREACVQALKLRRVA